MSLSPESIGKGPHNSSPRGEGSPDLLSHQVTQPLPDTARSVLPLVDYRLISVPAEAERRAKLLSRVTVDPNGVAHCTDDRSATETLLAAVRIDDNRYATLVPLEADTGHLCLVLPSDRPSRIGFFVGYDSLREVTAVLRMGLYPGVPLTTQAVTDERIAEVMYGLGGIKSSEDDEQKWAEQVGLLSTLGFDPTHARGMFNRSHRPNPTLDTWKESPIVVVPDEIFDMVRHYDPNYVNKDEFQVQFYGVKPADLPQFPNTFHYPGDTLRGGYLGTTRGGGGMLSYGAEPTKGLGIGFGEAVNRTAQTKGTNTDSLRGAFQIIVTPSF